MSIKCAGCWNIITGCGYRCDVCYMNGCEINICDACFNSGTNSIPTSCLVCCSRMNRKGEIVTRTSHKKADALYDLKVGLTKINDFVSPNHNEEVAEVLGLLLKHIHIFSHSSDKYPRGTLLRFRMTALKKCNDLINDIENRETKTPTHLKIAKLSRKIISTLRFGSSPGPLLTRFTIKN